MNLNIQCIVENYCRCANLNCVRSFSRLLSVIDKHTHIGYNYHCIQNKYWREKDRTH